MINLRNVPVTTMAAGGGVALVTLPFAHTLITHPIAGGIVLALGAGIVAKVQQHSADRRARKATERADAEREQAQESGHPSVRGTITPGAIPPANGHTITYGAMTDHVTHREA